MFCNLYSENFVQCDDLFTSYFTLQKKLYVSFFVSYSTLGWLEAWNGGQTSNIYIYTFDALFCLNLDIMKKKKMTYDIYL